MTTMAIAVGRRVKRAFSGAPSSQRLADSDPFEEHPVPSATRHDLLAGLHALLEPRTYLEIGVQTGLSLTLSRTRSVGVDPDFSIVHPVACDLDLVRETSDAFFAREDALAHFDGTPVDLAFIDGMHLSEFALRDFINAERHMSRSGVAVFDDVLPRNPLEAARDRRTRAWAGDVYKAVELIAEHRSDLAVVLVNTSPTGTAVVVGADPGSDVLAEVYSSRLDYLQAPDPQQVPSSFTRRSDAVDPHALLGCEAWPLLRQARLSQDSGPIREAVEILRALPPVS